MKNNSKLIELTVHTSCYWGFRLTLCYRRYGQIWCWFNTSLKIQLGGRTQREPEDDVQQKIIDFHSKKAGSNLKNSKSIKLT